MGLFYFLFLIISVAVAGALIGFNFGVARQSRRLAEEQALDKVFLASIGDGLIVTDNVGKIMLMNRAAEELLGLPLAEVVGKYVVDAIPMVESNGAPLSPERRPIHLATSSGQKVISTSATTTTYYFVRSDTKTRFPAAVTAAPVLLKQKIIGAVVTFRDITREKEIDEAKTEFVSLASHQLRTPLTAINWYIEMLLSGDTGPITDEQKSFLQEVYKGSHRMIQIVNEFLNVSRLESGRLKIEPKPLELIPFINDIIKEIEPLARARNCTIIFNQPPEKVPLIPLDGVLMRQVVHNLLTNALRYSTEGKCAVVVTLFKGQSKDYVISVKDDGIGIAKDVQPRIFEKFFRTENAIHAVTEGSGIGLYISKMIVEASNAKIWFQSEENKGTTFYVSIPLIGSTPHGGDRQLIAVDASTPPMPTAKIG
ncbi:MAG: PAS domain-containing protein [Candidatus Magasanikbacteria bacterium]|nr:PAS domain-containing protein [Candidatus Magasanikbacteria bacterium]